MDWMKAVMDAGEKLNHYKDITDLEEIHAIFKLLYQGYKEKKPKAARHLARCYEHGFGTEKDFQKAFSLYQECAGQGDISGTYYLGYLLKYGPESLRDIKSADSFTHKAMASGNENAIRSGRLLCRQSDYFTIDFSPLHDIFLRNEDGSLSPMDEPYFKATPIADGDYMILSGGDYSYVISDGNQGIAIDGGYGAGNIRKYMESVSGAKISAIANTHDHFDHTAGNAYFDKAYMTEKTARYAGIPFPSFQGVDFFADVVDRRIVHEGDVLTVGSKHLEVIEIADHAPGSAMYFVPEDRLLITGDEIFGFPMKSLRGDLKTWTVNMTKLEKYLPHVDLIYGGSGKLEKTHVQAFIDCAKYALNHLEEAEDAPDDGPREVKPERDSFGHIIYDRKLPHPGDGSTYEPEDTPIASASRKIIRHAGITLIFPA